MTTAAAWQETVFGRVPTEWNYETLEEFFELITYGFTNPMPTASVGPYMLTAKDIFNGKIQYATARRTTADAYENLTDKSRPRINDVLITKDGSIGRVAIVDRQDICISQSVALIRPNNRIDPIFLKYLLEADQYQQLIDIDATGSTIQHIYITKINKMDVAVPAMAEQKAIAEVLSSLDDKIDLMHRQNKTLEAMVETLFRQWFVEVAKEDWGNGTIADLIEFNPSRKLAKGSIAPYLEMAALSNATFNPDGWYDREFSSGTKFINGDTLLARITPCLENGKTAYVTFLQDGQVAWGSTEYIVMRPKGSLHPFFAYTLARNGDFRDYAEGCLSGSSGRQRVDVDHLKNYKIKIPSREVVGEFNAFAESAVPKLHSNSLQICTLEKLRDTLLPKLMSGEVRVAI